MRERRENSAKGLTSTSNNDDGKLAGGPGTKPTQKEDNTRQHLRKGNTEEVVDGVDLAAGLDPSKDASVLALLSATRTEEPPTPRDLACAIEQERDSIKSADAARDLARLRPIVLTLNRCIDEAWRGITTRLRTVDWANATVRGVHERITACDGDEDLRDVCYVTGACLEAVDYYATESEPHRPRNAEWDRVFRNASLDSLMASLAVVLNRTVTHLSASALQRNKRSFGECLRDLGLGAHLACALSPESACSLAYLVHRTGEDEGKLSVRVSRAHCFESAFADFSDQVFRGTFDPDGRRCKVFPVFRNEEGGEAFECGEGHGPRKEFFDLCAADLGRAQGATDPGADAPLFSHSRSMGKFWFNLGLMKSERNKERYTFVGWLLAQSIFNRTKLALDLSEAVFQTLVLDPQQYDPSIAYLRGVDPEAARSLENVHNLPQGDFESMLQLEGYPRGTAREEFVRQGVRAVLVGAVSWQSEALAQGFHSVLDRESSAAYFGCARKLREAVCGEPAEERLSSKRVSLRDVFVVQCDEELRDSWPDLDDALWQVLDAWPLPKKLDFAKFVTGTDRLPLPKTEMIKVELPFFAFSDHDHARLLGTLPQAHTCENLLELPNYWESLLHVRGQGAGGGARQDLLAELRRTLDDRLSFAVANCDTYALDTISHHAGEGAVGAGREVAVAAAGAAVGDQGGLFGSGMGPPTPQASAGAVTHEEMEFLAEDRLVLSPQAPGANGAVHGGTPASTPGKKHVLDASIDEMVDELGIEL